MALVTKDYSNLKLKLDGILGPREQHKRAILLDSLYAFLPKEGEAKVLMFHAEIARNFFSSEKRLQYCRGRKQQ